MIKEIEIVCPPGLHDDANYIKTAAAKALSVTLTDVRAAQVYKRSIDARSRKVVYRLMVRVYLGEDYNPTNQPLIWPDVTQAQPVIIVGAGPAGLFAALQCIKLGLKPIVLERGKDVKQRRRDLANINKLGLINPESNYCFGEGGAGTYSDGKLYTRSNKRGDVNEVLQWFVAHGADDDILIDARPHIGTNKLPQIITAIRQTILNAGGQVIFDTKVTALQISFGKITGVQTNTAGLIQAPAVILATGHSARDVFSMLQQQQIAMEAKPFALGVRIEHPQHIIDSAQYHCDARGPHLPPSYYSLVQQVNGRGVFSFCMCPGGIIAPCATDFNEIVVNGWSPSKRNNPFANSGTVVQVNLEDIPTPSSGNDAQMQALLFQQQVEQAAYQAGGGNLVAPAQRMVDFVQGRLSNTLPVNSYHPGTKSVPLQAVLPSFIHQKLQQALPLFGKKMKGYYTNEAILVGVESRTSSPIKIPRHNNTLQHPQVAGLFPCGEGAGYAGGIVSAAIDGINCAKAVLNYYQ